MPGREWDGLSAMDERRKCLQGKLQCNVDIDSAAHSRQAPDRPRASTQEEGGAAASGGGAYESVGFSESNVRDPARIFTFSSPLVHPVCEQGALNEVQTVCLMFAKNGQCRYGHKCKFNHVQ